MIYILFGVAGSGKTSVGIELSKSFKSPFIDADDYHSNENIKKMKNKIPLDDKDRDEWLNNLSKAIQKLETKNKTIVIACSALKDKYRKKIENSVNLPILFIHLKVDKEIIIERLKVREEHFFPLELIENQFEILELNDNHIEINGNDNIQKICEKILELKG